MKNLAMPILALLVSMAAGVSSAYAPANGHRGVNPSDPGLELVALDWGGGVIERRREIGALIFNNEVIERRELCASSCTMFLLLGADRVCTDPETPWGFHSAFMPVTGEVHQEATEIMVSMYPAKLQRWFWARVYGNPGNKFVWISGATIIANGWAHEC